MPIKTVYTKNERHIEEGKNLPYKYSDDAVKECQKYFVKSNDYTYGTKKDEDKFTYINMLIDSLVDLRTFPNLLKIEKVLFFYFTRIYLGELEPQKNIIAHTVQFKNWINYGENRQKLYDAVSGKAGALRPFTENKGQPVPTYGHKNVNYRKPTGFVKNQTLAEIEKQLQQISEMYDVIFEKGGKKSDFGVKRLKSLFPSSENYIERLVLTRDYMKESGKNVIT